MLQEVMNPNPNPKIARGNWGRWNFEQGGPDVGPPPLSVGSVSCVMSLPGCSDQTIHADTPHIYVHVTTPGHYINQFCYAVDDHKLNFEIGIIITIAIVISSSSLL